MLKVGDILNGEEVKLVTKKHKIRHFFLVVITILVLLVGLIIPYIYKDKLAYLLLIASLQFAISLTYLFLINNELDLLIVTSKRIIVIDKKNLFEKSYSEFELDNIKEIKATSRGLLQNMLNYGELVIKLKNDNAKHKLKFIPNAIKLAKDIASLIKNT